MSRVLRATAQNTTDRSLPSCVLIVGNMVNGSGENESKLMMSAGKEVEECSKRIAARNHRVNLDQGRPFWLSLKP